MMKVFISWSGERSQALAQALREWLPLVLHYVEPWLSEADVAAGERWEQAVAKELEVSNFGIICVTPENVGSPWVLFEAGALAKSKGAKVIPLLFNLEFSDITGPLAQFQAKKVEESGIGEVIQSINHATDQAIPDDRAKQLFAALWPELEKRLAAIPDEAPTEKHIPKSRAPEVEVLEANLSAVENTNPPETRAELWFTAMLYIAPLTSDRLVFPRHRAFVEAFIPPEIQGEKVPLWRLAPSNRSGLDTKQHTEMKEGSGELIVNGPGMVNLRGSTRIASVPKEFGDEARAVVVLSPVGATEVRLDLRMKRSHETLPVYTSWGDGRGSA